MLQVLKSHLIPEGEQPRVVRLGLFAGLRLNLNLRTQLQFVLGLWERETYRFVRQEVPGCEWAVDVGSGRGEYTLFFLSHPGMRQVIAVEPLDFVMPMLRSNLALNGKAHDTRLKCVEGRLGAVRHSEILRLDDLGLDPDKPGFIKLDVDGGEVDVLTGGSALLAGGKVRMLIETHSQELERDCISLLEKAGYRCQVIKNAWWRKVLHEERPTDFNRWLAVTPG